MNHTAVTAPNADPKTIAPQDLAGNGWYRGISATGIVTEHELWISEEGSEAVYVVAPQAGPMNSLARWSATPRELQAWSFGEVWGSLDGRLAAQYAAENWVVLQARTEVATEMDIELDA